jgi:stress-induced morphogen
MSAAEPPAGAAGAASGPREIPQPITCAHLEARLRAEIDNVEFLSVVDDSDGCGSKFKVIVVSSAFEGVKLLQRHRLVNGSAGALAEEMKHIHAMNIKAWTPGQYRKKMIK